MPKRKRIIDDDEPERIDRHKPGPIPLVEVPTPFEDDSGREGWLYPDDKTLKEEVDYIRELKRFSSFSEARDWWSGVSGGADYFVIGRVASQRQPGKYIYKIYDIRTPEERTPPTQGGLRGELDGVTLASQRLAEYRERWSE